MSMPSKIFKVTTIALSHDLLFRDQLSFLNNYFEITIIGDGKEKLKEVAERERIKYIPVKMKRGISPFHDLYSLFCLFLVFRKHKPDIVHSITPKAGLLAMLASFFANVPIRIHTFTGLIFPAKNGMAKYFLLYLDKIICLAATNVYPEGYGVLNDLSNYQITKKQLRVLANGNINGVDLNFYNRYNTFVQNEAKKISFDLQLERSFVFVFIGRLVSDKGVNELVKSFLLISNSISNKSFKLLLVGEYENNLDPLSEYTLEQIKSNNLITHVGFQKDVRPFISVSHCVVLPSYREGFPNVLLQGLAMEIPAIVTNVNGSNEIIKDGFNGLVIPVRDVISLRDAMLKIILDNKIYDYLKKNCVSSVLPFERSIVWRAILKEYSALLELRNQRSN